MVDVQLQPGNLRVYVHQDGERYRIAGGRVNGRPAGQGTPKSEEYSVQVLGAVSDPNGPKHFTGKVTVEFIHSGNSLTFQAHGINGRASPVQLRAQRGEPPAGRFENFEAIHEMLQKAYDENH